MASVNGVMLQGFHWYTKDDGSLWRDVAANARYLADAGFTALWLPPAYKGIAGKSDVGYGVYDMFDLGEFDQKGSVRTKYGTKDEYLAAIRAAQAAGLQVYADVVLNHRMGGDALESARAMPYPQDDRRAPNGPMQAVQTYTHFKFPGRGGKYSTFEYHWQHFDAVDFNHLTPDDRGSVWLFEGKTFDDYVALEKGNFAYLMGCDLDFQSDEVRAEITRWGKWYVETTGVEGLRLDAVKHISAWFFPKWLDDLAAHAGRELFVVGEYWVPDVASLVWYIDEVGGRMAVFDVPLHYHFSQASRAGGQYDMRTLLHGTLMAERPDRAVTFVENHDSQPLQALESVVEPWFKPLAYAVILLRREGYPCVFAADYFGAEYADKGRDGKTYRITMPSHKWLIDKFLHARKHYGHGEQRNYFDHWNRVGWVRLGDADHPKAMAVLMSDGVEGTKWMDVGRKRARFVDLTEHVKEPVVTNADGWGEFRCLGGSVSVWVEDDQQVVDTAAPVA